MAECHPNGSPTLLGAPIGSNLVGDADEPDVTNEFYFQWHITERCNRRCAHCYQASFRSDAELDQIGLLRALEAIHAALRGWGLRGSLSLTGGEPLLRFREVLGLVERCEEVGLVDRVDLLTNGSLLEDSLLRALGSHRVFRRVQVSLDGATAESHDSIRGSGSFTQTINAITRAKDAGIVVAVMMTLSQRNVADVPAVLELLNKLQVDVFSCDRFIPEGQSADLRDWVLTPDQTRDAYETMHRWAQGRELPRAILYRPLFCLIEPGAKDVGAMCSVGVNALTILPDGTLLPCRRLPIPLGNVLRDNLFDLWYTSPLLWQARTPSTFHGNCASCQYIPVCRGCRAMALAFKEDWLGDDPQCWLKP